MTPELLYKRQKWVEPYRFLEKVKSGNIRGYVLLSEIATWRGLEIVKSNMEEEIEAARAAAKVGLDFDDGLHYYYAKKLGVPIVSFDKDFDKTDLKRLEPGEVVGG